ncbi:hypothetical protein K439DRAFT_1626653 [Ramaria rubella]|nr:hypothetical protein K439DRAFT_1626653 [Ramaria rubella]
MKSLLTHTNLRTLSPFVYPRMHYSPHQDICRFLCLACGKSADAERCECSGGGEGAAEVREAFWGWNGPCVGERDNNDGVRVNERANQ